MEKKLQCQLAKLQTKYPQADIEVWCEDEQRLGLQPKARRVWTQLGQQPVADLKTQYQWLWLDGFLDPESGETYFWILPQVNTELFTRVLTDLAQEFELNQNKRILLVLDQAGWHTTDKLVLPEGIDLFFLPSHSPELQPAERLWPLTNEAIMLTQRSANANCSPENLDELEHLLVYRCQKIMEQQEFVRGLTCFHWWPKTRNA